MSSARMKSSALIGPVIRSPVNASSGAMTLLLSPTSRIGKAFFFLSRVIRFRIGKSPNESTVKSMVSASEMNNIESGESEPARAEAKVTEVEPARMATDNAIQPRALEDVVCLRQGRVNEIV